MRAETPRMVASTVDLHTARVLSEVGLAGVLGTVVRTGGTPGAAATAGSRAACAACPPSSSPNATPTAPAPARAATTVPATTSVRTGPGSRHHLRAVSRTRWRFVRTGGQ